MVYMENIKREGSAAALTPYLLGKPEKGTILIFPGGGYGHVSPRESKPIADAYNRAGYNAFVLTYTVQENAENPVPLLIKPLSDAAWAIAYIRENAGKYSIDPDRIVVCGFSAGGHLAASLGCYWHRPEFFGGKKQAGLYRPNLLILCYPVISAGEYRHAGSIKNLAGFKEGGAVTMWSMENQISEDTPPAFI